MTGASATTYASGDGTDTYNYTTTETFTDGETITLTYTQPTDGLEDSDGGDLASFSGESVTNSISGGTSDCEIYWDAETATEAVASLTASMPDGDGALNAANPYAGTYAFRCSGNGGRAVFTSGSNFPVATSGYVSMWVNATTADLTSDRFIFQIANSTYDGANRIGGYVNSLEILNFRINANGTSYTVSAPNSSSYTTMLSGYTFVEFVWAASSMEIKINGATVASNATTRGAMTNTLNVFGIANEFNYNTYSLSGDYDNITLSGGGSTTCP